MVEEKLRQIEHGMMELNRLTVEYVDGKRDLSPETFNLFVIGALMGVSGALIVLIRERMKELEDV